MKRLAIAFVGIALIALSCSTSPPVAATLQDNSPLTVEFTLRYTIELPWHGTYYPGSTAIHVELTDVPIQTDHQQVQATLEDGSIETINGRETWVIDTTTIYTTNTFTGTFVVRVNVGNTPAVPHQPLTPVSGMDEYLSPDNYVTLSADVVSQAQQLVSGTEDDVPKIIAKFVDWIQKNITYDQAKYEAVISGISFPGLTDSQVLNTRAGVCGDYSNLFMGFCRATGIPARRVVGFAPSSSDKYLYKNIRETYHGWTEVWVSNYGWLTVDPTWADIGDVRKIAAGSEYFKSTIYWQYSNAPSGSGITSGDYSITLTGWRVIGTTTPSTTLTKENTENAWEITVKNNSPMPLLDNVAVEKTVESLENQRWSEWSVVSNEIIFMNPQETHTFSLDKESGVGYWVRTPMAENNGITMWQYLVATPTTLSISPSSFSVSSRENKTLTATLTADGSPLTGKVINWTKTSGYLSSLSGTTDSSGQVSVTYTAPTVSTPTTVIISASFVGDSQHGSSSDSLYGTVSPTTSTNTHPTTTTPPAEVFVIIVVVFVVIVAVVGASRVRYKKLRG